MGGNATIVGVKGEELGQLMKKNERRRADDALPPEIGMLLQEIEREPIPERLLQLARQLQAALSERRRKEEEEELVSPPVSERVTRSR